jgi:hypothetical protein
MERMIALLDTGTSGLALMDRRLWPSVTRKTIVALERGE